MRWARAIHFRLQSYWVLRMRVGGAELLLTQHNKLTGRRRERERGFSRENEDESEGATRQASVNISCTCVACMSWTRDRSKIL